MHGEEGVVASVFDRAFAVAVDEDGALLSLGIGDTTDVDEGFDYVVEGVDVVVPQHQLAAVVFEDGGFVFRLGTYVWFVFFHLLIMGFPRIS